MWDILQNAKSVLAVKCIAKNRPVASWTTKQSPNKDPKFHRVEILLGIGMSTKAPLAILNNGWDLRIGVVISR